MISVIIPVLNESERVRSVIEFAKADGSPASNVGGAPGRVHCLGRPRWVTRDQLDFNSICLLKLRAIITKMIEQRH